MSKMKKLEKQQKEKLRLGAKTKTFEVKSLPAQSNRQIIAKDILLVGFSVIIGFLFSINPAIAIISLIIFSFVFYIIILEALNIPLFSTYNIKLKFNSEKTAHSFWNKIHLDYTIFGILHDLLDNEKIWPKIGNRLIDLGDFSDTSQIILSSSRYDIIQTVIETLKNFEIKYDDKYEYSFSSIKSLLKIGKCWKARPEASNVELWYIKKRYFNITGHGAEDTFKTLCQKLETLNDFKKMDDESDFKLYTHEEQNIFSQIIISQTGSQIIIGLEYNETGGLSWRPSFLINTNSNIRNFINDIKKYHKKANVMSTYKAKDIEAVKYKTGQKECITVRKVANNSYR